MNKEPVQEEEIPLEQLVVFRLGEENYAVSINSVQEIIPLGSITRVPRTPPYVKGIINLRGKIIPVIDLKKGLLYPGEAAGSGTKQRIIVVEEQGTAMGLIVDAVQQIVWLPQSHFEPAPALDEKIAGELISGIGRLDDGNVMLLDMENFFCTLEKDNIA